MGGLAISTKAETRKYHPSQVLRKTEYESRYGDKNMNRNSLLAIAVLAMVGAGLGIVSAQWMAPQSPVEDTVLYSAEAYGNGTGTGVTMVTMRAGKISIGGAFEPPRELTPEERQEAIDIALADSEVQELLDGREYEIECVKGMPSPNLNREGEDMQVAVMIGILNVSEGQNGATVMVNLDEKEVVEVVQRSTFRATEGMLKSLPPTIKPLTPVEEEHAIDIALSDPDVQELLDGREYNVNWVAAMLSPVADVAIEIEGGVNANVTSSEEERVIRLNRSYRSSDRYASVHIDILNESANMTAYMTVVVNLNESIVERLSFEMSRGGGLMMSHSMPVSLTMAGGSYIAGTYEINESDNASRMGYGISIFDAEP